MYRIHNCYVTVQPNGTAYGKPKAAAQLDSWQRTSFALGSTRSQYQLRTIATRSFNQQAGEHGGTHKAHITAIASEPAFLVMWGLQIPLDWQQEFCRSANASGHSVSLSVAHSFLAQLSHLKLIRWQCCTGRGR